MGWAAFGLVVAPISLLPVSGYSLGARAATGVFAVFMFVFGTFISVKRGVRVDIGESVQVKRLRDGFAVPRSAISGVTVQRRITHRSPTTYSLRLHFNQRDFKIPFAEHWFFGARKLRQAQALADQLGVPIEDPTGERWAQSRFPPVRWMAAGHDWLFGVAVAVPVVAVLAVIGVYAAVQG